MYNEYSDKVINKELVNMIYIRAFLPGAFGAGCFSDDAAVRILQKWNDCRGFLRYAGLYADTE